MKIHSIELENFRQYQDKQLIEFSTNEKNVTVILGENGRGKTGIFRALIFCLYGDVTLSQDAKKAKTNQNDILHLVNINKLNENIDVACTAKIEVIFTYNGEKFVLTRTIREMKTKKNELKKDGQTKAILQRFDEYGNYKEVIEDNDRISTFINQIINNELKEFFFFDGQHSVELTDASKDSKEKIKEGILKLLQIDKLEKAINIVKVLKNEQRLKAKSTNTSYNAQKEILEKLQLKKETKEFELEQAKINLEKSKNEKILIEKELQENVEVKELFNKKDQENYLLNQEKKQLDNIKKSMQNFIKGVSQGEEVGLLVDTSIINLKNYLELDDVKEEYISNISLDLINEILMNKRCICGSTFENGDDKHKIISEIAKKINKTSISDFIRELNHQIKEYCYNRQKNIESMENLLKERNEIIENIDNIKERVNNLDFQIKATSQSKENLKEKDIIKNSIEKKISDFDVEIKVITRDLVILNEEIKDSQKKVSQLEEEEAKQNLEISKLRILEKLEDELNNIYQKYSNNMRIKLSTVTTELFKKLIDESDKQLLKEIKINESYEITAVGWSGDSILWDLSAGQKHIVSLAFVTALAKVAAGEERIIDLPLFIDTPFGNISGNNRDNLLTALPKLTSQLILLVTDTEFTRSEISILNSTNKWDKFYKIDKLEQGSSIITKIEDTTTYLGRG